MKRTWLQYGIAALLLAVAIIYVARNTYWDDVTVDLPLKGAALEDDYYAARRILASFDVNTEVIGSLGHLSPGDILMVPADRDVEVHERFATIRAWVERGGRLILTRTSVWSNGELQSWSGIAPSIHERPKISDRPAREACPALVKSVDGKPTGEKLRACVGNGDFSFTSRRKTSWALGDERGMQLLRVPIGAGSLTVLDCECMFTNRSVLRQDHARILFESTAMRRGDRFRILDPDKTESLLAMLWRLAAPAMMAAALVILFLIWRNWPRFGPLEPVAPLARRSLAEQIRANAQFAWRTRRLDALRTVEREAVERSARRRIRGFDRMNPDQQAQALAAYSRLPEDTLRDALSPGGDAGAASQSAAIELLERTRRSLEPFKSNPERSNDEVL